MFNQFQQATPEPFMLSSGRVQPLARGWMVRVLDSKDYKIVRCNTSTQSVMVQKINSNERPFGRQATDIWLPPPPTAGATTQTEEPMCFETSKHDVGTEAILDREESLEFWADEFITVQELKDSLDEAKAATRTTFNLLEESVAANKAKDATIKTQEEELKELRERVHNLTMEREELHRKADESKEREGITSRMLLHQLSTYPDSLDPDHPDEHLLFNLLCLSPTTEAANIHKHARHILKLIHPDKNPEVSNSLAQKIPLIKEARQILSDQTLNKVYRCCGLDGVERQRLNLHTCYDCDPMVQAWR